jgi:hypothetical protein
MCHHQPSRNAAVASREFRTSAVASQSSSRYSVISFIRQQTHGLALGFFHHAASILGHQTLADLHIPLHRDLDCDEPLDAFARYLGHRDIERLQFYRSIFHNELFLVLDVMCVFCRTCIPIQCLKTSRDFLPDRGGFWVKGSRAHHHRCRIP